VIEVRPALPSEYTALGELTASTYLREGLTEEGYAATLRDVAGRAASSAVLVALYDGRLVGGITAVTQGGPYAEGTDPGTAVIRMLATDPAARGLGVGQALVEAAIDLAREHDCLAVRLSTQPMMTAAHRLYERLGFVRTPEDDWYPEPDLLLLTYLLPLVFCGHCGQPGTHEACLRQLELDPPRYCSRCRRRMVVQVHPTGWSARCVEHGTVTSS
jgi:GNAT superfamily N-acetyltransferase